MRFRLKGDSGVLEVDLIRTGETLKVQKGDYNLEVRISELPNNSYLITDSHKTERGYAIRRKDDIFLHINGRSFRFQDVTHEDDSSGSVSGEGDNKIAAPMPGSVIKLLVGEGDEVKINQPLVIVEAMKMENEVSSGINGVVKKILVEAGQQVGFGELLIELAPFEGADDEKTAP